MSYLAIGSVTNAIAELLSTKLNKPPLFGTSVRLRVTTLPPDDDRVDRLDGVNLFLYRISESPFARNMDWRRDRNNTNGVKSPPLAFTLNYLLTAYAKKGDDLARDDITAHQIFGNALTILHENPVLNDVHDNDFDAALDLADELRDSFEKIKITPTPISMEEVSKIWTGLSKAYRLSVAYDVSLVQIAPMNPAALPGPTVQRASLAVATFGRPQIESISRSSGPVGADITLNGGGFKTNGILTTVAIGGDTLSEEDLSKLTEREIELKIPEAPQRGPKLALVVSAGGLESQPVSYEVSPWVESISPQRGITKIPLTIPFEAPDGATIKATIDGVDAIVTTDAVNKVVRVVVPHTIQSNGPKPLVLIVNTERSNVRLYELMPGIVSVTVSTAQPSEPVKTTITVRGSRLNGADVNVKFGKLLIKQGQNSDPNQVIVEVPRTLPADQPVSVLVDGRESNILPPRLDRADPAQAFAGEQVTLAGAGLSGESVFVRFGATDVSVGAHPYPSRLSVTVPAALPVGTVAVKVTVDGNITNEIAFEVLA